MLLYPARPSHESGPRFTKLSLGSREKGQTSVAAPTFHLRDYAQVVLETGLWRPAALEWGGEFARLFLREALQLTASGCRVFKTNTDCTPLEKKEFLQDMTPSLCW